MAAERYAYLHVEVQGCDLVRYPGGGYQVVEAGTGAEIVEGWNLGNRSHVDSVGPIVAGPVHQNDEDDSRQADRVAAYEVGLARWESALRSRLAINEARAKQLTEEEIREVYERDHPRPGMPVLDRAEVDEAEWWFAVCPQAEVRAPLAESAMPMPRLAIAELLTALAEDGWSVVHVSEDRTVQHQADVSTTVVTGVAMLMRQETPRV